MVSRRRTLRCVVRRVDELADEPNLVTLDVDVVVVDHALQHHNRALLVCPGAVGQRRILEPDAVNLHDETGADEQRNRQ